MFSYLQTDPPAVYQSRIPLSASDQVSARSSGQIPVDPATGEVAGPTMEEQAEQSCKNVKAVLEEGGSSLEKVIKTTCFLADMADFVAFNGVYAKYFVNNPARSCVAVKALPKGVLCEVEAIAYIED